MGNIEIKTAQNVSIEFETATALERTIAWLIDYFVVTAVYVFLMFIIKQSDGIDHRVEDIVLMVLAVILALFSMLFQEVMFGGRTLGKRALGIKIIKLNGREATPNDFFIRWGFKLIDVAMSWGLFAMFVVSSSKRGQRLGDIVANTTVIKLKQKSTILLKELMKMHIETDSADIKYPEAKRINDEYALVIKHVLERYNKYKNPNTSSLVKELAEKLKSELNLEIKEKSYVEFLKIFLSDYIKLTR